MRLLQNLLITSDLRFFEILFLSWRRLLFRIGLSLAKQLMSPQKMFVINKVRYFVFLVCCLYTFNPLSLSMQWVMTLVGRTKRNMEKCQSWKNTSMTRAKRSERRPFIFIFRLIFVLHD